MKIIQNNGNWAFFRDVINAFVIMFLLLPIITSSSSLKPLERPVVSPLPRPFEPPSLLMLIFGTLRYDSRPPRISATPNA